MNIFFQDLTDFFGIDTLDKNVVEFKKNILASFRKPFIKKDITTHGPLWNQYVAPNGIVDINEIILDKNTQGYIFVDGQGKDIYIFHTSWEKFANYLQYRRDGLYPAIYFIDENFTSCFGENGERGSMKPVYIYIGLKS